MPAMLLGACNAPLSTLDPAGPHAEEIHFLWIVMLWGATVIALFLFGLTAYAALARNRPEAPTGIMLWGGGIVIPMVTLSILLVLGVRAGGALVARQDVNTFQVNITGHQWWWEVSYPGSDGREVYSANEVHIPAGRPVQFNIRSADVIHSFWIPRLGGKVDAMPGITNTLSVEASAPGAYRGLCAEFCGAQHARMYFDVFAHDPSSLTDRLERLSASTRQAPAPFEAHCAQCHNVDPHARSGAIAAPNLADLPMRRRLGAGALPNTPDGLREWITNHQIVKPGNRMPVFSGLPPAEIEEIVSFLEARR
jgi:cytochrome c oxidase subunit II